MGFKSTNGPEIFCHASDEGYHCRGRSGRVRCCFIQRKTKAIDVKCVETGAAARAAAASTYRRERQADRVAPLEDEEPARVFLSRVSDVGSDWIEDQQLGAVIREKACDSALIHAHAPAPLKRRWVEYGRRRLDNNTILSTFEYVAWPEQVRSQYLAPDMYPRCGRRSKYACFRAVSAVLERPPASLHTSCPWRTALYRPSASRHQPARAPSLWPRLAGNTTATQEHLQGEATRRRREGTHRRAHLAADPPPSRTAKTAPERSNVAIATTWQRAPAPSSASDAVPD